MSNLSQSLHMTNESLAARPFSRGAIRAFVATERHHWKQELDAKNKRIAELEAALRGYHRAANSIPFAQWTREMHQAEIVLEGASQQLSLPL